LELADVDVFGFKVLEEISIGKFGGIGKLIDFVTKNLDIIFGFRSVRILLEFESSKEVFKVTFSFESRDLVIKFLARDFVGGRA